MSQADVTPKTVSQQDRFRGLMVGTAVGDACGRPIEGIRIVPESYIDEMRNRFTMVLHSDDTILTMALTESLLACDGFVGEDMADRFVAAWQDQPERGYGSNVVMAFGNVLRGMDWEVAAKAQFGGSGSYGNGGAMRVAPVALWAYPDLDETIRLARETAKVTHTHPVGVEGAVIQAVAVHHSLKAEFDPDRMLADLDDLVETEEFRKKFDILPSCLEHDDDERARLHLGNWVAAHNSVVTAL
jgi:poly(ADP-ribose) glycohydrolase ARH3